MYVKYRCDCIADATSTPALAIRCGRHGEGIRDWASDYKSLYRVAVHWKDGKARFALHRVEYDEHGFVTSMERESVTAAYSTTSDLAREARDMGLSMEEVSDIFYDRYIEFREFHSEED